MTSAITVAPAALAEYEPGAAFGPRRLREFEFVWLLRGSVRWTVHGVAGAPDQTHLLQPGQLALSRVGAVDSYHWDERRRSVHGYVHFELPPSDWPAIGTPSVREMAQLPLLGPICDYLIDLGAVPGADARARTDQLVAALFDLHVGGPLGESSADMPEALVSAQAAVRRAWRRDGLRIVGADELAAAAGLSPGHLFRLFRSYVGAGPAQALELIRLSRAATMLQRSNSTLAEVARTCGFANPYHLSRRFARAYGVPPGRFRRSPEADPLGPVRAAGLLAFAYALTDR